MTLFIGDQIAPTTVTVVNKEPCRVTRSVDASVKVVGLAFIVRATLTSVNLETNVQVPIWNVTTRWAPMNVGVKQDTKTALDLVLVSIYLSVQNKHSSEAYSLFISSNAFLFRHVGILENCCS